MPQPVDRDSDDGDPAVESQSRSRSRREKSKKHQSRSSALERLKAAKSGNKDAKYACAAEEENVFEYVDEEEYSSRVLQRQQDDWIVDDDGAGYAETGFEIFDEEGDDENNVKGKKGKVKSTGSKQGKEKNPDIKNPNKPEKKASSLKAMFSAQAASNRKKAAPPSIASTEDNVLRDIMSELKQEPVLLSSNVSKPASAVVARNAQKGSVNPFGVKTPSSPMNSATAATLPLPSTAISSSSTRAVPMPSKPSPPKQPRPSEPCNPPRTTLTASSFVKFEDEPSSQPLSQYSMVELPSVAEMADDPFENDIPIVKNPVGGKMEEDVKQEKVESKIKVSTKHTSFSDLETGWDAEEGDVSCSVLSASESSSSTTLPIVSSTDGQSIFRFYWIDAYEDNLRQPGTVYLFGKTERPNSPSAFVSVCLVVKEVERLVYFLPRRQRRHPKSGKLLSEEEITFQDVYTEVNEMAGQRGILKFKSKKVDKKYAFGTVSEAPHEGEYLQVMYSAKFPAFPADFKGETFSHVFGTNTSFLENFLIQRRMKGPCWLDVTGVIQNSAKISWCQIEASVNSPSSITICKDYDLPPPPLIVMSLSLRTLQSSKTHQNEICLIAALVNHHVRLDKPAPAKKWETHLCAITKPSDQIFPFDFTDTMNKSRNRFSCDVVGNERGLLSLFLAKLSKIDPDVLVGHDILGLDFDALLSRIHANKVPLWSKLGRLKRSTMPKLGLSYGGKVNADAKLAAAGRLVCDTEVSAKELIRAKSYDLSTLVNQIIKPQEKHSQLDEDLVRNAYQRSEDLVKLIELTLTDANHILALLFELNILPLAHQITTICGNTMGKTLSGGRAERNTFLLLHAFNERGYICPDKVFGVRKKGAGKENPNAGEDPDGTTGGPKARKKPQYAGGLVLEPKKGFYDKFVLLLDFNSLYPSIIQEYNICFTTIDLKDQLKQTESLYEGGSSESLPSLPDPSLEAGVLPTEIRRLVESRRSVKQLLKTVDQTSDLYCQYDIRQKALKLTANSMYGCLGFSESRFHAKPLAALVTSKGRETLMKTKELALSLGLDVIYGDTDSIMINTNSTDVEQVFKLGQKVKAEVNKLYKLLEIDIDGIFKSMLLLKKKKYAALTMSKGPNGEWYTTEELKGLDIVRRDWCDLAKDIGRFAVSEILSGKSREEIVSEVRNALTLLNERVRNGTEPLESFVIQKQLVKHPEEYPDKKSLPHVQVAIRNNSRGGKKLKAGDTIPYIICIDGSNSTAAQRSYHPEDLAKMDNLSIDVMYYLTSQVHPVVSRLCDPIDGLDAATIASTLGLNPADYIKFNKEEQTEEDAMMAGDAFQEALDRFKDCDRLQFACPKCEKEQIMDSVFKDADGVTANLSIGKCSNSTCDVQLINYLQLIKNKLSLKIRDNIRKYYANWSVCEDSACHFRTRRVPLIIVKGQPGCPACGSLLRPEMAASHLHDQLMFFSFIFDWEKGLQGLSSNERDSVLATYGKQEEILDAYQDLKTHVDAILLKSSYNQVDLSAFQSIWC